MGESKGVPADEENQLFGWPPSNELALQFELSGSPPGGYGKMQACNDGE